MTKRPKKPTKAPSDSQRRKLLALLADGNCSSGEELARTLRVTRSAVWKLITKLRALGIEIEAQARQGYKLPHPVQLYSANEITSQLSASSRSALQRLDALLTVDSTNRHLLENGNVDPGSAAVCVAEVQTAGRGRRGRSWLAPFGSGICFSLAWQFAEAPPTFSALSLVVGLAVVRAIERFGTTNVQLKWPNDLVFNQKKLAGILIEMRGETGGPARVVIGIGLNLRMPAKTRITLAEQQAALITDLHEILGDQTPSRNALVASMIDELVNALNRFATEGFSTFATDWSSRDSLLNEAVRVISANETINGISRGVAADGSLQVEVNGQLQRFMSGDVSLRSANK